ncbi:uncharacterized protein L969DRAFT_96114 [Mixia osmundae IAM 14324]|uniref:MHD domain-containing protein n=1 Tax=Mixia osmundae (strain CBS 9802 / IAM 14324 / JCM 22182 / KY 12970) TaxID=764103 RepID=G7EA26_MIXOS|nr:uncharacterized protein L969DRAFT_96114 [Mixia osmundae IAM 14324]KEI37586.1 hypothetical protein L969DRAFT_96114 [Mixia osmundae IAM 14324]GAA99686.1 hypothetical protein E5Q_06389 [Mixia osmundae IAM 14324]
MEGLIILDSAGKALCSHFRRPGLAVLVLDAFASALSEANRTQCPLEPVIWVPGLPEPVSVARRSHDSPRRRRTRTRRRYSDESASSDSSSEESSVDGDSETEVQANGFTSAYDAAQSEPRTSEALIQPQGSACCHILRGGLRFILPVIHETDPTLVFAFLEAFVAVLQDYFGEVSESTVKDNFDVVYALFEDVIGPPRPVLTDSAALKELVPPPSLSNKVLSVAAAAINASAVLQPIPTVAVLGNAPLSSPILWRRNGIRYTNNEIYFDVLEEVGAIVDARGKIVTSEVWGKLLCKCRLSGVPDLQMSLSQSNLLQDVSFHPCVRLAKWHSAKLLSFVPPDGHFTLLEYRLGPPNTVNESGEISRSSATELPISLKAEVTSGRIGGSFKLTLASKLPSARPVEAVRVIFPLGPAANGVTAEVRGGPPDNVRDGPQAGTFWEFDPAERCLLWTIRSFDSSDRSPSITGTWTHSVPTNKPASSIEIHFNASLVNMSGIKVDSLKVLGDRQAPYKGVRPMLRSGKLEFRWH